MGLGISITPNMPGKRDRLSKGVAPFQPNQIQPPKAYVEVEKKARACWLELKVYLAKPAVKELLAQDQARRDGSVGNDGYENLA